VLSLCIARLDWAALVLSSERISPGSTVSLRTRPSLLCESFDREVWLGLSRCGQAIVIIDNVLTIPQHYMYLKQLEWNKWAAADEVRRAAENQAEENGRITPEMQIDKIPPVTPSRHVLATTAAVQEIANPPQPRKTPRNKRVAVEDTMDEDMPALNFNLNKEEGRDHSPSPPLSPMKPVSKPSTRRLVARAAVNGSTAGPLGTPSGIQTRSATAARASANHAAPPTARAAAGVPGGRIPRLTRAKDTESTLPGPMTTRSRAAGKPPPPVTHSRLPKPRIPAKRTYVTLEMDSGNESGLTENARAPATNGRAAASSPTGRSTRRKSAGAKLRLVEDPSTTTEWISSQEAVSVVRPAAKGGRPSLRNVKRRRSSFSSADVVA
jgi:cell division cycle 14